MEQTSLGFKRMVRAVIPAFLLAVSVGQIYAFTNFSDQIAGHIGESKSAVQFAFSLGIFFLGMGAAFFGKIVERNIRLSTIIGTTLFISGLLVTALGVRMKSLALIYLGYGFLVGTGTGIIYISPVKTMMLWFPNAKAIAAAVPIIVERRMFRSTIFPKNAAPMPRKKMPSENANCTALFVSPIYSAICVEKLVNA